MGLGLGAIGTIADQRLTLGYQHHALDQQNLCLAWQSQIAHPAGTCLVLQKRFALLFTVLLRIRRKDAIYTYAHTVDGMIYVTSNTTEVCTSDCSDAP
jgi:hypothetical protein